MPTTNNNNSGGSNSGGSNIIIQYNKKKILLGICVSYYNDLECLKRLLGSIKVPSKYRDNVLLIAIDGRYQGFDSSRPDTTYYRRSQDGSYELIELLRQQQHHNYARVINTITPTTFPERMKRQHYVNIASVQGCDFILIIDSDEWLEVVNWRLLFEELEHLLRYEVVTTASNNSNGVSSSSNNNIFTIHCVDLAPGAATQPQYRKRLWARPESMSYGKKHSEFSARGVVRPIPSNIIQIWHDPIGCRSAARLQKEQEYRAALSTLEQ